MPAARRTYISVAAWHEAGHALAAMREGRWVVAVEVSAALPGNGVTRQLVRRRPNRFNPMRGRGNARAAWLDTLERYLPEIRVALAGPLAEAKAVNRPLRALGAELDLRRCQQLIRRLEDLRGFIESRGVDCGPPIAELVDEQRRRVRRWLGRPHNWGAIERIAHHLMARGRITAREVFACYLEARAEHQRALPLGWDAERIPGPVSSRREAA
jgi:hypothetical protein